MRKNSLEPKRLTFVVKNTSDAPWLVLIEGKKGAKPFLKVTPPVVMYNQDGEYTDFIKKLYWGE
jgi:tRNA1(Val) A37 N6-methylase TrmN6